MADVQISVTEADVQIAVIDQKNTQLALAAPDDNQVNIAVPGVQGPIGATGTIAGAQDGTAAAPGISFLADTDTGIYRVGANSIGVSTGGVSRFVIDAAGQIETVGLGSAAAPAYSWFGDQNTGIYSPGADQLAISTGGTGRLFVNASGNVGIGGAASAGQKLYVAVDADGDYAMYGISPGASGLMGFIPDGTNGNALRWGGIGANAGVLRFLAGATTERMRIDSSGRLLVGTSTARSNLGGGAQSARLQIEGTTGDTARISQIQNANSSNAIQYIFAKSRGTTVGSNTIVQSGDGIGQLSFEGSDGTNFVQAASITGAVDGTPGANDMPGRLVFSTTADGASSSTERLRITSAGVLQIADAGNIAVGTTTGTKIGTATTQKLGFFNKTPVVQPTAVADATDAASVITQLNALLARMRDLGLIAT